MTWTSRNGGTPNGRSDFDDAQCDAVEAECDDSNPVGPITLPTKIQAELRLLVLLGMPIAVAAVGFLDCRSSLSMSVTSLTA